MKNRWISLLLLFIIGTLLTGGTLAEAAPLGGSKPLQISAWQADPGCPAPSETSLNLGPGTPTAGDPIFDYVLLFDVSASMEGFQGSPNILADVKAATNSFIDSLARGSVVTIVPFGDPVNPDAVRTFNLGPGMGRTNAKNYIDNLRADNGMTQITAAVSVALDELTKLRDLDPERPHVQTVLLYTDGQGNGAEDFDANGLPSVDNLLQQIDAYRSDQPFLYVKYVALGLEPNERDQLTQGGVEVVEEATGVVNPIRDIRLAVPRTDLGVLAIGDQVTTPLCLSGGDGGEDVPLQLTLNQDDLPLDLQLEFDPGQATLGSDGVPLSFTLNSTRGSNFTPGDYAVQVNVTTANPAVVLSPASFPLRFRVNPPPPPTVTPTAIPTATATPLPTSTPRPTATPLPTATPSPTPLPTATPVPTATPSPTPLPTATPIPTATPPPTATPIPTPTPTPVPLVSLDGTAPLDLGSRDVSTWDDGGTTTWSLPLALGFENGAAADLSLTPDFNPAIEHRSFFRTGGSEQPDIRLSEAQTTADLVVEIPITTLQALGLGEHQLTGDVRVASGGAAFTLANAAALPDGSYSVPYRMTARVVTPTDWGALLRIAGAAGVVAALVGVVFAARPALPKSAELLTGAGGKVPVSLAGKQSGLIPGGISVGSQYSAVPLGLRTDIGQIRGKWGFPHKAYFVPEQAVSINGLKTAAGESTRLTAGDKISFGRSVVTYNQ